MPQSHEALFPLAIDCLQPAGPWLIDWFYSLLLRNSGWAAWCRYLQWQAELNDKSSPVLPELLAIQLAREYLLDDGERGVGSLWQRWQTGWSATPQAAISCRRGLIWQRAAELATHAPVLAQLPRQSAEPGTVGHALHAVFCIDVRSEPMRRALEQVVPDSSTAGFAGFFGLPVAIRFAGEAGRKRGCRGCWRHAGKPWCHRKARGWPNGDSSSGRRSRPLRWWKVPVWSRRANCCVRFSPARRAPRWPKSIRG
ncbi:putative inorganic carbon transporter subunit DabA [Paludibacterium denitrificans]|uniref:putative inorganic carbon transporter subunit DabA n=1 Tax=Paludibacterium denitrificans TaxID=2675226 RepID=UPI002477F9A6|nr:putative inorganic carbon transporter subunit DabA [Paludibacterium denitrificans]